MMASDSGTFPDRRLALASISVERTIDLAHLARVTIGEDGLERSVLQLFGVQAMMLMARMRGASPCIMAAMAHTLKSSARGIGVWRVAHAAEEVELAARGSEAARVAAIHELNATLDEARSVIAELLRLH